MRKIGIKNFKCFNEIEVPLNGLTMLTGANGNGKSTILQALLLLRRTIEHCARWDGNFYVYNEADGVLNVGLNDTYCLSLGISSHIFSRHSSSNNVSITFYDDDNDDRKMIVDYSIGEGSELYVTPIHVNNNVDSCCPLLWQQFYYLNAERIGPRINNVLIFQDYPNVGWQGQQSAQILGDTEFTELFKVDVSRREAASLNNPKLVAQVNSWLSYILPGVEIEPRYSSELLSAQIRIENRYSKGEPVTAPNMGFGISYVIPIIITGLIAKKGSIMIVENPEAHLHPSAQSRIGRFLAKIAEAGVNVVVETHSDHVINGIQIAVAKNEICNDKVVINFLNQANNELQPELKSITVNEKGELSDWPQDFFDQTQIDYMYLFQLRK